MIIWPLQPLAWTPRHTCNLTKILVSREMNHPYLQRFCLSSFLVLKHVHLHFPDAVSEGCLCMLAQQRNISVSCLIFCIFFSSYIRIQPVENSNIRKLALNRCQAKCQQKVHASLTSNGTLPAQHPADTIWDDATGSNGSSGCFLVCSPSYSLGWLLFLSPWVPHVLWRRETLPLDTQHDQFPKEDWCWECK